MQILRQREAFASRMDDGYTFHYHTDLDTIPDRVYDTEDEHVEEPYFYPPGVEVRHNGKLAGFLSWQGDGQDVLLKVHPDHRRKGLGRRLVEEARKYAPNLHTEVLSPMGAKFMDSIEPGKKHTPNGPPEREEW